MNTEKIKEEMVRRMADDPLAFPRKWPSHNTAQIRAIRAVGSANPMVIITFGNGTGKTHALMSIWSAIMFGTSNPLFSKEIYKNWPWPKSARLCGPESLLDDTGVIQRLMAKLFPAGRFRQNKNRKSYFSEGETNTGWTWDVMTYDQSPLQATGETKGLLLYSEPPPVPLFKENIARLRAGGMCIMEMTPLFQAGWAKDDYIDPGILQTSEGKVLGRVEHVTGDIWENCDERPGGQLSRVAIEIMLSQYTDEERELREMGLFGQLQGLVYRAYSPQTHDLKKLPEYHQDCFNKGNYTLYNVMDPHDRKPFALGWYCVFPNEDVVCVAEFPDDAYPLFHKMTHFPYLPADYAKLIKMTEEEGFGKPAEVRWMDPNFGLAPSFSSKKSIRQELYEWGQKNRYPLNYGLPRDAVEERHVAVKSLLGNEARSVRAKLYFMDYCLNHRFAMAHYGYKESMDRSKGLSETPQLVYKDFADLVGYGAIMGFTHLKPSGKRSDLWRMKKYPGRAA